MRKIVLLLLFCVFFTNEEVFAQNNVVDIECKYNDDNTVEISYVKRLPGSYFLKLTFSKLDNCSDSGFEGVIKGYSGRLLTLRPMNTQKNIKFSYNYRYFPGTPNPKVNRDFHYVLPFKSGKTVCVSETKSLRGEMTGKKELTWKSYLVERTSADTVCSMRKGIVTKIVAKYDEAPSDAYSYTSQLNSITIEHKDGTFSKYKGLNKDLIFVKLGQTVYPQTPLGILNRFDKSTYRLYFNITYLKALNNYFFKQRTLDSKSMIAFVNPFFYCKRGVVKIIHNKKYTVAMNDDVYFKEFTRREKRKYKKHPERFQ